jgi:hypothetical protein
VKKYIRNMSYIKRMADKIRSAGGPVKEGLRDGLGLGSIEWKLKSF